MDAPPHSRISLHELGIAEPDGAPWRCGGRPAHDTRTHSSKMSEYELRRLRVVERQSNFSMGCSSRGLAARCRWGGAVFAGSGAEFFRQLSCSPPRSDEAGWPLSQGGADTEWG